MRCLGLICPQRYFFKQVVHVRALLVIDVVGPVARAYFNSNLRKLTCMLTRGEDRNYGHQGRHYFLTESSTLKTVVLPKLVYKY